VREIKNRLKLEGQALLFGELFSSQTHRIEIVVTFLALLELIRLGQITVRQRKNFADITLYSLEDGGED